MLKRLFRNYPNDYREAYIKKASIENYGRVFSLFKLLVPVSYGMFFLSYLIKDDESIQVTNLALMLSVTILFMVMLTRKPSDLKKSVSLNNKIVDAAYIVLVLWSASMVGYNSANPIVYFDLTIVVMVLSFYYLASYQKVIVYLFGAYFYLVLLTPFCKEGTNYLPITISPVLFMIFAFVVSRITYQEYLDKFIMNEMLKVHQLDLEKELVQRSIELKNTERQISRDIIKTLVKVLEYYDDYTRGHSENVAMYAKLLAEEMGLSLEEQDELYVCGLVHDIGKILIPLNILNKSGNLSKDEYEIIKKHSEFGYEMLIESEHLTRIANIILHHHEHWNGKGYPKNLKHENIPIESQILMVADTWDAMRSHRVYRPAKSVELAKEELEKYQGSQFSPVVVEAMLRLITKGKL